MPQSLSRLVLGSARLEADPVAPAPMPVSRNRLEPFPAGSHPPSRSAEAAATLGRVLQAKPELESALPENLATPTAKLLYLVTHRKLSAGLGALHVPIGAHDGIRLEVDGRLALSSPGKPQTILHNRHDDLARLLDGANGYDALEAMTLEGLLSDAVHRFYAAGQFDGGGAAANQRGERAFTYATIVQVLVTDDPSQRGLECLASASVHLWKSMGLVPPGLSREEFEHRYTSIHGARGGPARLGPEFNKTLRGGRSDIRLDAAATSTFANTLRGDDWAKLTGASNGRYTVRSLPSIDAVVAHFEGGGAGVRVTWGDGGHYFVLSGARADNGQVLVNEDDSLRRTHARRKSESDQPYLTPYDESRHTRFWTLERR